MVGESFPDGSVTASVTGDGTPIPFTASAGELERGDVLAGRFQIEAIIGTGGSGRVLRAFDRESRMLVALKLLRQELAGEAVWAERFARELRVGRAISHPNVCRVFDIGEADGHRFLSMELATGGSLRADVPKADAWQAARRAKAGREWPDRVSDARAIVAGVTALHQAGIVHRDLKPENILRMHDGRLVVTDFGLATDPGSGPGTTIMVGTPSYMAPEVVMGDPATMRSDVWGLGVVLHEIFFGMRPQWKVVGRGYRRFVRPEAARTTVERAVADLCGRCADDDPQSRPETAVEVGRELERALRGRRVIARHVRRRILWGATAVAAAAGLLVVKTHFTNRAEASSSQSATGITLSLLQPTGMPEDWSTGSATVAVLPGQLHCYAALAGGTKVRAVWGAPRVAEDIDLAAGTRTAADLLPETFLDGCPALSPSGDSLLFEKRSDTGTHVFLSRSPQGRAAKQIVRGGSPAWLPNGQEFIFEADGSHVAMFSIPTGEMTLFAEPAPAAKRVLSGEAVDAAGSRVAVRYTTSIRDSLVVVYSLPSLEILDQIEIPFAYGPMRFDGNSIEYIYEGKSGALQIASIDLGRSHAVTSVVRSTYPSADLKGIVTETDADIFFSISKLRRDLWYQTATDLKRITDDGVSVHGSYSPSHDLLLQRELPDGRRVIFFRGADGSERQLTSGPSDATPTFLPERGKWLYVALDQSAIFECDSINDRCKPLHRDNLIPVFPASNPSGREVAYITAMNASRLRIFSRARPDEQRDLGPAGATCPPYWITDTLLWTAQNISESTVTWVEVDASTGARTGRQETMATSGKEGCALPPAVSSLASVRPAGRVVTLDDYTSAIVHRPAKPRGGQIAAAPFASETRLP